MTPQVKGNVPDHRKRRAIVTLRNVLLQLLTVAGGTGATGAHVVRHVGLELASGPGNVIILLRGPEGALAWDFRWKTSLAI